MVVSSAALSLVEIIHDDVGFSSDPVLKNLMNVGGYLTFESGATMIMCECCLPAHCPVHVVDNVHVASKTQFDQTSLIALLVSGLLIFTTIHAQDFADAEGDKRSGRRTLPIIAPEGSRVYIFAALPLWSIALSALWGLGPMSAIIFLCMGAFVGSQYFRFRDAKQDEKSYVLYNVSFFLRYQYASFDPWIFVFSLTDVSIPAFSLISRYGYWLRTPCL